MTRGVDLRFPQGLVVDKDVREMFEIIRKFMRGNPLFQFRGMLIELPESKTSSQVTLPHNLGFRPKDALLVSLSDPGATVRFYPEQNTDSTYRIFVSSGASVRFLLGTFGED